MKLLTTGERIALYTLAQIKQLMIAKIGTDKIAQYKSNWGLDLRCRDAWTMIAIINW